MSVSLDPIERRAAVLGLVTVLAASARYLVGFADVFDPAISMEPYYIEMAKQPVSSIVARDPAWGTLYGLWLKPLRILLQDPLEVYATNVQVLSYMVSALVYLCALLLTRRVEVATATALLFLVSYLNVPLASKVCLFAVALVLMGVALSLVVEGKANRTAAAGLGVLLASYARPELYGAGLVVWGVSLWQAGRESRQTRERWIIAGSLVIVLAAVAVGTPLWSPYFESDRLFGAFSEHFARNWGRWNGDGHAYLSIWQQEFGDADSIVQALIVNPAAVVHHLFDNFAGVLSFFATGVFDHHPLILPQSWSMSVKVESLILSASFLVLVGLVFTDRSRRRVVLDRHGHLVLLFAVVSTFSLGAATVVFPNPHYMAVPGVFWILGAGLAASAVLPRWSSRSSSIAIAAALACVAATPTPFSLPRIEKGPTGIGTEFRLLRPVTDTVRQIRSLGLKPPVHVLSFTDGIGELLGDGFEEIKIWNKGDRTLEAYIREAHVEVIVTMERGRNSFLVDDPYWTLIETDPAKAGFSSLPTHDPRAVRIYLRQQPAAGIGISAGSS